MSDQNNRGLSPTKIIERSWEGIPGAVLCFPVSIAMSSAMAKERENNVGLSAQDRAERLLDFRFRTMADVLDRPPYLLYLDKLQAALDAKVEAALDALPAMPEEPTDKDYDTRSIERKSIQEKTRLTEEEVEALKEPLPDFPETTPDNLRELAYEYFNREDARGHKIFQPLIEELIAEYWYWVTPRPTISVSAFTQGK
jgi:hypothetical protein